METPWDRAKERQGYIEHEARISRKPGARAQPNSGRHWTRLLDVSQRFSTWFSRILFDAKSTDKESYSISKKEWAKVKRNANRSPIDGMSAIPAMALQIQDLRLVVFEEDFWDQLVKYLIALEARYEHLATESSSIAPSADA